ncbi:MAG TPA: helical backbone metal receptor [Gemmatimonadota bacterium]|nr:helical backbone metal receptor [Gemmatimonadota bacterium]
MGRTWIGRMVAAAAVAAACGGEPEAQPEAPGAVAVVDDAGRRVALPAPARRIVSLVPSVTETVVALGGADRLVARTRYDLDPALAELPSVGGGLDPAVEALVGLRPDLVVAWNARDDRILRPRLAQAGIPVYSAAVEDTAAVFSTIERIGILLGRAGAADSLARTLRDSLAAVAAEAPAVRPAVLYLIDGDPPRTAGAASFIGQLVGIAGGRAAFPELDAAWPAVSLEAILARSPDVIVLPEGPGLPTAKDLSSRPGWRDLPALEGDRVVRVPADLLARPGPGIARAARALRTGLARLEAP